MILIKNGVVVDPENNKQQNLDILIQDDKIKKLSPKINVKGAKIIDAKDLFILPGLIDMHVHIREPGNEEAENFYSGTRAAAVGGITTIVTMPNTTPPMDNISEIEFVLHKSQSEGVVKIFPAGAVTKNLEGKELAEIGVMVKAGCVAITDDGHPIYNNQILRRVLEYSKIFDIPVIDHCENPELSCDGVVNEGKIATKLGLAPLPRESEYITVFRDIAIAKLAGGRIHIPHVSTKESVHLIRKAKQENINVTAETCPHYFTLTEDDVEKYYTNAKMNPPLRTKEDIDEIIKGLVDGTIDVIASDHAPHTLSDKEKEFDLAPFGIIGVETLLPLSLQLYFKKFLNLIDLTKKITLNPAKILKLKSGVIKENYPADITIVDLNKTKTIKKFVSRSSNSPFINWKLKGFPVYTIVNGKILVENGKLLV